jgi:hypothetical protein
MSVELLPYFHSLLVQFLLKVGVTLTVGNLNGLFYHPGNVIILACFHRLKRSQLVKSGLSWRSHLTTKTETN